MLLKKIEFIQTVANRIIEILPDGKLIDKLMTYDDYIQMKIDEEKDND